MSLILLYLQGKRLGYVQNFKKSATINRFRSLSPPNKTDEGFLNNYEKFFIRILESQHLTHVTAHLPGTLVDSPRVSTLVIATSVEEGHRLVRGPRLKLFEVSAWMRALGATFVGRLDVHPRGRGVDHIRLRLAREVRSRSNRTFDLVDVRTRGTRKPIAGHVFAKLQEVSAVWTESQYHIFESRSKNFD